MKKYYSAVLFFSLLLIAGCSNPKLAGKFLDTCEAKQVGRINFINNGNAIHNVSLWESDAKRSNGRFPETLTLYTGSSRVIEDLAPGSYYFESKVENTSGMLPMQGTISVAVCRTVKYTFY